MTPRTFPDAKRPTLSPSMEAAFKRDLENRFEHHTDYKEHQLAFIRDVWAIGYSAGVNDAFVAAGNVAKAITSGADVKKSV